MKHRVLILFDRLLRPIYLLLNTLKWRGKVSGPETTQHFVILKFFGVGSLTRIVHVMESVGISKDRVTFITLDTNKEMISLLGVNASTIRTRHPFILFTDILKNMIRCYAMKNTTVLDMERASNLSGIFRLLIAIGKPCASFYFKAQNRDKRGQLFVSLKNKSATAAIAEMFGKSYFDLPPKRIKRDVKNQNVFVNINAGNYLPQRKFLLPEYATLVLELYRKNTNWQFCLTGSKSESNYVELFKERLIDRGLPLKQVSVMAGQYNLAEFADHLKDAMLFITNDSGPLHLAYMNGVKTVGIWGPTSPGLVGYANNEHMLNLCQPIECSPCFIHPKSQVAKACQGDMTCFKSMDPKEMAAKIISFVEPETEKV